MSPVSKSDTSSPRAARRRFRTVLAALAVAGLAAGCAPETTHWKPAEAKHRNEVKFISFAHEVRFAGASGELSDDERKRLMAFLSRHEAGYGDELYVGARGRRDGASANLRAGRREAAVSALLRATELTPRLLPSAADGAVWNGSVDVVLGRYIVIPPKCPDWSKPANGDSGNSPSSNLGCATETNLGLMVANPRDLIRGDTPGPADGESGARLYRDYRDGKQKELAPVTPLIIQSGTGNNK